MVYELVAGAVIGGALGFAGAWALRRAALPSTGLYPLATIAVCVLAYAAGQFAHASGLLATYVAALVLGNSDLPHRGGVLSFAEGTGWLAQIGLFVLLGLYASPPRLVDAVVPALVAGARAAAGRPAAVGDRRRAAVPGALAGAGVPVLVGAARRGAHRAGAHRADEGAPNATALVDVVFVLVVVLTLLQGTTLPWVARLLGVVRAGEPRELEVDAAPLDELDADLLQVRVPVGSRLHGVYLRELRLPRGATVSLVVRDDEAVHPDPGDPAARTATSCWSSPPAHVRGAAEDRIRAVDMRGRLARWSGGSGVEPA